MNIIEHPTDEDFASIEGWCSKDKRVRMIGLIKDINATAYIEVGVYGGSSLIPVAREFKNNENGICYGIDPWSKEESGHGFAVNDPNHKWWTDLDHSWVKGLYDRDLDRFGVRDHVKTYVCTSEVAAPMFPDCVADVVHIDGNHSVENSTQDVQLWVPKLREGGYLVMDDTNWVTTQQAQNLLVEKLGCQLLERYDTYSIYKKLNQDCTR